MSFGRQSRPTLDAISFVGIHARLRALVWRAPCVSPARARARAAFTPSSSTRAKELIMNRSKFRSIVRPISICVPALLAALSASGCATVVEGHERALFYTASHGLDKQVVSSGWYWHWPWNDYITYDLRWTSHKEEIHIHSKDGLHMNIDVAVVVRPDARDIYALDTEVGPAFYDGVVKAALFAAVRDASGQFDHMQIATETHSVEKAIYTALVEHLKGKHVELSEVAIQHFDLPPEVEQAANRKASERQLVSAKEVELTLAQRDAKIVEEKKRGVLEAEGLERKLRAEQQLAETTAQIRIEEEKRKAELAKAEAESEAVKIRADAEAHAIRVRAEADRVRIQAASQNLSPNYVRVQALEALSRAVSASGGNRVMVLPVGKDGLPGYFAPFLNPFGNFLGALAGSSGGGKDQKPEGAL
jgi:regulator of protease activity HflC (stomatin/prohibitin superfamily)